MSSDGCPMPNSQEYAEKLSEMTKYLAKFEVNYDAYTRKPDKKKMKDICAMIRWEEQQMLNTHQGISWLYCGNWR